MKFSDLISTPTSPISTRERFSASPSSARKNSFSRPRPHLVDLESGQKFWRWNLDSYLSHFEPTEPTEPESKNNGFVITVRKKSPNYYSDMNAEEREEKLKSAIFYCRNSST